MRIIVLLQNILWVAFFSHCTALAAGNWVLNNPYSPAEASQKIYYATFGEQPKTLDPAKSYSSNEYQFIAQIYEPPLQYDYLIRPYKVTPLTAAAMPVVQYFDRAGNEVKDLTREDIAKTVYTIHLQAGILYQPHPAFAKNSAGNYRYLSLYPDYLEANEIDSLSDFAYSGTRELVADDYIYAIKRLADPMVNSPIYGLMSEHIDGFRDFVKQLPGGRKEGIYIDLRRYPLVGIKKIDDYTFSVTLNDNYPQFLYWLAMPFFSPIPWEVDKFYASAGMSEKNLGFGWYPAGTGPFMMVENNPNSRIVLAKNPHYRLQYFPFKGSEEDKAHGYLSQAGKRIPFIDKAIYSLEKESIPRWNKFLQGYYDQSGVSADSFDQAIQINKVGDAVLSPAMEAKGMRLSTITEPSIYYLGFNMLDPVVGGRSQKVKALRQAISIAINYDENIALFFNGRGQAAQGPLPPGIFGYREGDLGINPFVYRWDGHAPQRRSIEDAKRLMKIAGYPGGIDPKTKAPLILHYDVPATGGPDDKAQLNWMQKQFSHIGIALNIRATQYNRFQEKMRAGNAQIFSWGWNADYPDPENFFFLLYGPNGKVKFGGENAANYANPKFDQLFLKMKSRPNDATRQMLIDQMVSLLREEAPWVWGIHSETFVLSQQWVGLLKPNNIALNTLKYLSVDVDLRNTLRAAWNRPRLWPIFILLGFVLLTMLPFIMAYRQRERQKAKREILC